jgi:hypothetical protein
VTRSGVGGIRRLARVVTSTAAGPNQVLVIPDERMWISGDDAPKRQVGLSQVRVVYQPGTYTVHPDHVSWCEAITRIDARVASALRRRGLAAADDVEARFNMLADAILDKANAVEVPTGQSSLRVEPHDHLPATVVGSRMSHEGPVEVQRQQPLGGPGLNDHLVEAWSNDEFLSRNARKQVETLLKMPLLDRSEFLAGLTNEQMARLRASIEVVTGDEYEQLRTSVLENTDAAANGLLASVSRTNWETGGVAPMADDVGDDLLSPAITGDEETDIMVDELDTPSLPADAFTLTDLRHLHRGSSVDPDDIQISRRLRGLDRRLAHRYLSWLEAGGGPLLESELRRIDRIMRMTEEEVRLNLLRRRVPHREVKEVVDTYVRYSRGETLESIGRDVRTLLDGTTDPLGIDAVRKRLEHAERLLAREDFYPRLSRRRTSYRRALAVIAEWRRIGKRERDWARVNRHLLHGYTVTEVALKVHLDENTIGRYKRKLTEEMQRRFSNRGGSTDPKLG